MIEGVGEAVSWSRLPRAFSFTFLLVFEYMWTSTTHKQNTNNKGPNNHDMASYMYSRHLAGASKSE